MFHTQPRMEAIFNRSHTVFAGRFSRCISKALVTAVLLISLLKVILAHAPDKVLLLNIPGKSRSLTGTGLCSLQADGIGEKQRCPETALFSGVQGISAVCAPAGQLGVISQRFLLLASCWCQAFSSRSVGGISITGETRFPYARGRTGAYSFCSIGGNSCGCPREGICGCSNSCLGCE